LCRPRRVRTLTSPACPSWPRLRGSGSTTESFLGDETFDETLGASDCNQHISSTVVVRSTHLVLEPLTFRHGCQSLENNGWCHRTRGPVVPSLQSEGGPGRTHGNFRIRAPRTSSVLTSPLGETAYRGPRPGLDKTPSSLPLGTASFSGPTRANARSS